jgi:hypothetical protein
MDAILREFYRGHVELLDGGEVDAWLGQFTPDARLANEIRATETVGIGAISAIAARLVGGGQRRHLVELLDAEVLADGTVRARSRVAVATRQADGSEQLGAPVVWLDHLVGAGEGGTTQRWRVRERRISPAC